MVTPSKIWFYILFLPSALVLFSLSTVYLAFTFEWGNESNIPIPLLLGLFFAEFTMVASGLGIVAFIRTNPKSIFLRGVGVLNITILITAGIIGYNIFMNLK
ncbi:MAG: hypothetical protein ISR69_04935 [Gammaproteobacteria bacterium]|nr:hypothetical protein [Gammaproteobacteria bacterium]